MATRNDITGDQIKSRNNSEAYKNNWDAIFGKKKQVQDVEEAPKPQIEEQPSK